MEYINKICDLLLGVDSEVNLIDGKKIRAINFDNAATTPPFKRVMDDIITHSYYYGSIGRGAGQKAEKTTKIYEESREIIKDFFNIKDKEKYTVIYVANTTDGINKLSRTLIHNKNDIVLSTRMEHHSNDLPWRRRCTVKYVEVDNLGRLDIEDLERKLRKYGEKVKYVTVTGASNVTGYKNDIHKIAVLTHKYKARIIVDGAQLVPHIKVNMEGNSSEEGIDFLVFSGHKLYAPFGAGVIVGLKEAFQNNLPDNEGGGTVNFVMDKKVDYLMVPEKEEAGTPNYFGVIAIISAIRELDNIGFDAIKKHETNLRDKLIEGLVSIPNIINYGDIENREDRLGIGVFNIEALYHAEVAKTLAKEYGISIRQGWFCAHPYCRRLMNIDEKKASAFIHDENAKMPGMIRVSFGIYNDERELNYFLNIIEYMAKKRK